MPIVTLLTDFGLQDHYVTVVKGRILKDCPTATIVDISHHVKNGNIAEAGFLVRSAYASFPKGTVHLVAIGGASMKKERFIAASLEGHYFILPDNGLLSLLSESKPATCVELPKSDVLSSSFPAKFVFAPAAAELLNGMGLEALGEVVEKESLQKLIFRRAIFQEKQVQGAVIHVDHYGNLITNIDYASFEQARKGRKFEIRFGYEKFTQIHLNYNGQEYGDCVLLFNSQNLLEIAINQGNAAQLLGLAYNSPVHVSFEDA